MPAIPSCVGEVVTPPGLLIFCRRCGTIYPHGPAQPDHPDPMLASVTPYRFEATLIGVTTI
jgi:hypothetical protein